MNERQFSLASLFIATAFVAAACALVRFIAKTHHDPVSQFWSALLVPIMVCGGIGALRGRVRRWLGYGVAVDLALMLYALVSVAFGW